jgi:hypothetical protein
VARPTALRLSGAASGLEGSAAAAFRAALLGAGIEVGGGSGTGVAPAGADPLASDRSAPLAALLAHQNHESDNLYAELTTKLLGDTVDVPGSTASGARVIRTCVAEHFSKRVPGVAAVSDPASGQDVERDAVQRPNAGPGSGVLPVAAGRRRGHARPAGRRARPGEDGHVVRAADLDASGYVTTRDGRRVAFSVLTHDLSEATAVAIEDAVVRAIADARIPRA